MPGGLLDVDVDEALVDAVRAGDDDAFRQLVDRHRDWLTARCRRHLAGDAHAAEDVAQECFVALQRTLTAKDGPMRVRAWLSVVARNRCIDEMRKLRAVPTPAIPEVAVFDREVGAEDEYLARAWSALTGRHRAVLELRELGGLSYDEIAARLAVTSGAVEALLFRARSALRREYARAGGKVASMAPMQEAVARASGHKGVLTGLAEQGHGLVSALPSLAEHPSPPRPTAGPGGLIHELQARLLTTPGVDSVLTAPPAEGGRLRAALAAVGLLLGGAATVAGTVASDPAPVTPPPAVVTVPDAPAVSAPPPPAPPTAEAPAPTTPPTTAPPAEAPVAPPPPPSASSPVTVAGVDVPAAVDETADAVSAAVEGTVDDVADLLTGLLTRPR